MTVRTNVTRCIVASNHHEPVQVRTDLSCMKARRWAVRAAAMVTAIGAVVAGLQLADPGHDRDRDDHVMALGAVPFGVSDAIVMRGLAEAAVPKHRRGMNGSTHP